MNSELLTIDEVAALTRQTRRTVTGWIESCAIAHIILGKDVFVRPCKLEQFLEAHELKAVGLTERSARESDAGKAAKPVAVPPGPPPEKPAGAGVVEA